MQTFGDIEEAELSAVVPNSWKDFMEMKLEHDVKYFNHITSIALSRTPRGLGRA
jgi:hypothetical protein